MSGIHVYNINSETHEGDNAIVITRPSVLGNPYTHIRGRKTRAAFLCRTRDDAIDNYSIYFDQMYGHDLKFTSEIDRIINIH